MPASNVPMAAIRRCAADREFLAAMESLYDELDEAVAAHAPVCVTCGDCCRFQAAGHRLFVTSAELAYFLAHTQGAIRTADAKQPCPHQASGRCTTRRQRPVGCRVFFCDPAAQPWQGPLTEQTLDRLRDIHRRFAVPYAYVEWTAALNASASSRHGGCIPDKPIR
ncbi:MAG: hypothetical protein JSV19_04935 [Phycisphaerales bacterium]|nr:MAG: hypothetical protein JSV19_04935 [Phycisphaerales bacterium]